MASEIEVTYDGHELHTLFVVEAIDRPAFGTSSPTMQGVGDADGGEFVSIRRTPPSIKITLATKSSAPEEARLAWATLSAWLHVDGPRVLHFSDDGRWYYAAVPTGAADASLIGIDTERGSISFVVPDCRMWALEQSSVQTDDLGVARVSNPPNRAPIQPHIWIKFAGGWPSGDDDVYTVKATEVASGEVRTMSFALPQVKKEMVIDCAQRYATWGDDPVLLSLDDDFLSLEAGTTWDLEMGWGQGGLPWVLTWRDSRWC